MKIPGLGGLSARRSARTVEAIRQRLEAEKQAPLHSFLRRPVSPFGRRPAFAAGRSAIVPWTPAPGSLFQTLSSSEWETYQAGSEQRVHVAFAMEGSVGIFKAQPNEKLRAVPALVIRPNVRDAAGTMVFVAPKAAPVSDRVEQFFVALPNESDTFRGVRVVLPAHAKGTRGEPLIVMQFNFVRGKHRPFVVPRGQGIQYDADGTPLFTAAANYKAPSGRLCFYASSNANHEGVPAYVSPWFGTSQGRRMHFAVKCNTQDAQGRPVFLAPVVTKVGAGIPAFVAPCTAEYQERWFA